MKAIHNGADDNASGVAILLNLAAKMKGKNIKIIIFLSLFLVKKWVY
jgi:Zn-dependent M28 family amino/carboxypeptidase